MGVGGGGWRRSLLLADTNWFSSQLLCYFVYVSRPINGSADIFYDDDEDGAVEKSATPYSAAAVACQKSPPDSQYSEYHSEGEDEWWWFPLRQLLFSFCSFFRSPAWAHSLQPCFECYFISIRPTTGTELPSKLFRFPLVIMSVFSLLPLLLLLLLLLGTLGRIIWFVNAHIMCIDCKSCCCSWWCQSSQGVRDPLLWPATRRYYREKPILTERKGGGKLTHSMDCNNRTH